MMGENGTKKKKRTGTTSILLQFRLRGLFAYSTALAVMRAIRELRHFAWKGAEIVDIVVRWCQRSLPLASENNEWEAFVKTSIHPPVLMTRRFCYRNYVTQCQRGAVKTIRADAHQDDEKAFARKRNGKQNECLRTSRDNGEPWNAVAQWSCICLLISN